MLLSIHHNSSPAHPVERGKALTREECVWAWHGPHTSVPQALAALLDDWNGDLDSGHRAHKWQLHFSHLFIQSCEIVFLFENCLKSLCEPNRIRMHEWRIQNNNGNAGRSNVPNDVSSLPLSNLLQCYHYKDFFEMNPFLQNIRIKMNSFFNINTLIIEDCIFKYFSTENPLHM